jgi:hypothetical protein
MLESILSRGLPGLRRSIMKILVTGSRTWTSKDIIKRALMLYNAHEVAQGGALGADCLAWRAAYELGAAVKTYPADWKKHGKAAGPIRNTEMLADFKPDIVLAFWDGVSRGTKHMIETAVKAGYTVKVFRRDGSVAEYSKTAKDTFTQTVGRVEGPSRGILHVLALILFLTAGLWAQSGKRLELNGDVIGESASAFAMSHYEAFCDHAPVADCDQDFGGYVLRHKASMHAHFINEKLEWVEYVLESDKVAYADVVTQLKRRFGKPLDESFGQPEVDTDIETKTSWWQPDCALTVEYKWYPKAPSQNRIVITLEKRGND